MAKNDQLFRDAPEVKLSRLRHALLRSRWADGRLSLSVEETDFVLRALAHLTSEQVGHVVRYFETAARSG